MDRRLRLWFGLLALLTLGVYLPTLGYPFVYEDLNDPTTFLTVSRAVDVWHPHRALTSGSYGISQWISPFDPFGFHLVNLVLHLVNGCLLLAIARRVVPSASAVVAAGVFWLHPVQVEAVAYVSGRADLLATTCLLGALWAVVTDRAWLALPCCVLAVFAKETAVSGMLLVPLAAWWRGATWPRWLLAVWCVGCAVPVIGLIGMYGARLDPETVYGTLTQITVLLGKVVWPTQLAIDHDWAQITAQTVDLGVPLGVPVLMAVGWVLAILIAPRSLQALLVWCLVALLPRFVVPLSEGLHEHHLYLLLPGVVILGAHALHQLQTDMDRLLRVMATGTLHG